MLSHGGSRLNASKPEANPKTSCPKHKNPEEKSTGGRCCHPELEFSTHCAPVVCVVKHSHSVVAVAKKRASRVSPQKQHVCGTTGKDLFTSNRIASQTIATFRWPRWREVHEKFTRLFHFSGPFPGNVLPSLHITIPKPRRQRFAGGKSDRSHVVL